MQRKLFKTNNIFSYRARGLVVMTTPLQGVGPRFELVVSSSLQLESPGGPIGEAINWLCQFNVTAAVVQWLRYDVANVVTRVRLVASSTLAHRKSRLPHSYSQKIRNTLHF